MFTINDDNSIYATRGDIVFFTVTAEDDGVVHKFQPGDVVRIKVYGKKDAENVVLQKDFPVAEVCEEVEIFLTEEDTKIGEVISKPKDYWYEVELNPGDNPQTIVGYDEDGPKVFKLFPEGDDIPPAVIPEPEDIPVVDDELDMTSDRPVQNQAIARAVVSLRGDLEKTDAQATATASGLNLERARLDNLLSGATADGAETVDIRVGLDGELHSTAGGAVRNQFANIRELLDHFVEHLCQKVKTIEYGKRINAQGVVYDSAGYVLKTVEVTGGKTYYFTKLNNARNATVFLDAAGNFICTFTALGNYDSLIAVPQNAAVVKYEAGSENDFIIPEEIYNKYGVVPYALNELVNVPKADTAADIEDFIDIDKTTFSNRYLVENLLNPDEIEPDCYYSYLTGAKKENETTAYYSTGLIRIGEGQTIAVYNPDMRVREIRMACYYNKDKEFVSGEQYIRQYTQSGDIAYVRFAIEADATEVMVADIEADKYMRYGEGSSIKNSLLPPRAEDIKTAYYGGERAGSTTDSLAANVLFTVDEFPHYIKNGLGITFRANFDTFSNIKIGKGYKAYRGYWLEITQDKVISKKYESAEVEMDSVSHGLEVGSFIQVCVDVNGNDCAVTVNTLGGSFTHTFEWDCEQCGALFATGGQAMTGVKLSAVCKQLRSPCWLIGDSYFGVNPSRVWGHLEEYFDNVLVVGLAGLKSVDALVDLNRCLKFSAPKFIVWYMGMNDGAANYRSTLATLRSMCESLDITLILNKVPCTPTMDKSEIDTIVVESGLRYIDSASAVGVNGNQWYAGYLSADDVHPTTIGAKALAMQMLVDVPEIMQY